MSDANPPLSPEAIAAAKARLLEKVAAEFDRDMALAAQLAAKYPGLVDVATLLGERRVGKSAVTVPAPLPAEPPAPQPQSQSVEYVEDLVREYRTNPDSPFQKVRFATKTNYESLLKRFVNNHHRVRLADLQPDDIRRLHNEWSSGGAKPSIAHSLITMFRMLVGFGVDVLKHPECERLSYVLHRLRFPAAKRERGESLTAEQAIAIRAEARRMGLRSMALAQAFQFDCEQLRQKDLIGEWVPVEEPGMSDVTRSGFGKWISGARWNQIDDNLKLRHTTSFKGEDVEIELRRARMVMEELQATYCELGEPLTRAKLPKSGPIIVYEESGYPYLTHQFRRVWREIADAVDVPKHVKNRDTRGGGPDTKRAAEALPSATRS